MREERVSEHRIHEQVGCTGLGFYVCKFTLISMMQSNQALLHELTYFTLVKGSVLGLTLLIKASETTLIHV